MDCNEINTKGVYNMAVVTLVSGGHRFASSVQNIGEREPRAISHFH